MATDKFIGSARIPGDILAYAKQTRANSANQDSAKLLIDNNQWNAYIARYMDLPEADAYKQDLAK